MSKLFARVCFCALFLMNIVYADVPYVPDPFDQSTESEPPQETALLPLSYAKAKDVGTLLQAKQTGLLSDRGHIAFDVRTNSVWVQDTAAHLQTITHLIEQLDVPVEQVLLKAKIITIDQAHEEEFGVRFGLTRSDKLGGRFNVDMPSVTLFNEPASVGLAVARLGDGVLLDMELSAMERDNVLEIIASPRLIASHETMALIESGSEIPYQEQTAGGGSSAAFKKAVMSLQVTPRITKNHHVMLTLEVKQDKPGVSIESGKVIETQHMKSQVLVGNNETIVVGGIEESKKHNIIEKVPVLGDIPLLGRLFTHKTNAVERKELLIFITPTILEAA